MPSANSINRIVALLAACTLLCATACENNEKALPEYRKKQTFPEEGRQLEIYLSENSKIKGKLTSPYMLSYQQADTPYMEFPKTLHVDFFNDSLQTESQMDALYGKYFKTLNKVYLRDTVVVKNILKGDTLHCDDLWWDQRTGNFTTDKAVRIYSKDKITFGVGMTADQNFRYYTIKNMTGSVLAPENGLPK